MGEKTSRFACREHRDEAFGLIIYIILFIVLLIVAITYELDMLNFLLILIIIIPLFLNAYNNLNRPCSKNDE